MWGFDVILFKLIKKGIRGLTDNEMQLVVTVWMINPPDLEDLVHLSQMWRLEVM